MICFKNLKGSSTMIYFIDNFKEIEAMQCCQGIVTNMVLEPQHNEYKG